MRNNRYEIRIWQWQVLLHSKKYEFENDEQADMYAMGLYAGLKLAGKEVTGYRAERLT